MEIYEYIEIDEKEKEKVAFQRKLKNKYGLYVKFGTFCYWFRTTHKITIPYN